MRPRTWALAVGVALNCVATLIPLSAQADEYGFEGFGPCTGTVPCSPDDESHYWCFADNVRTEASYAALRTSVQWAMANLQAQTVMTEEYESDCYQYTDVRIREVSLGDYLGIYVCNVPQSDAEECASADVILDLGYHFDAAEDPNYPDSDGVQESGEVTWNRDLTACHEIGHSTGLKHQPRSWYVNFSKDCMVEEWIDKPAGGYDTPGYRTLNGHHRDHINDYANAAWL